MAPVGPADKKNNNLPVWGNEKTMNLNNLILTNILSSPYFKVNLYKLKTYHEVVDEIYYNVQHLEPWEKGSRKTSGQTGMCGGVRGVGAGGIVSTAFCILYKLFTLKLTRKQVNGLMTHCDSPYIRALGFMYLRFTQPPGDLIDWYEPYFDDEEELDVKAGGGQTMTIGEMLRHFLTKLEWFSTLFPRIPVPIQKEIEQRMLAHPPKRMVATEDVQEVEAGGDVAATADEHGGSRRNRSPAARDSNGTRDVHEDVDREHSRHRERRRSRSRDRHSGHSQHSRSREDRAHRSDAHRGGRDGDRYHEKRHRRSSSERRHRSRDRSRDRNPRRDRSPRDRRR
uniref:Pre-mRNA-splicing factor 38 n=1 Tax=Ornithodoros turicata TaxID=34597 RepID=A0A2R5LCL1_9ACAR